MKNIFKSIGMLSAALLAGTALQSCSLDEPFGAGGEGVLQMELVINSDVTRAESDESSLAENCVVYISSTKGLIHKYVGLQNLPDQLVMNAGHYVAEAWTGDSVPASFDKKFYRGYQGFDISAGVNQIVLNCKIANVVASINAESIDEDLLKDFKITVANSRGSLDFTAENYQDAKGYFMMPYNDGVWEDDLKVTVSGKNAAGEEFTKEHTISGVQRAHEYVLSVSFNPEENTDGAGYITIIVDDNENLIEDSFGIYARPSIQGVGFDIEKQIVGDPGQFAAGRDVKVVAFNEIRSFSMECLDNTAAALGLPSGIIDLKNATEQVQTQVNAAGITWDKTTTPMDGSGDVLRQLSYIHFSQPFLNNIPEKDTEYRIQLTATDGYGKTTVQTVRIAVGKDAIVVDDPVTVDDAVNPNNRMAILATKATLTGTIEADDAANVGIRYRQAGTESWTTAVATRTRAKRTFSVELSGLTPGTRYEYQAVADGFNSDSKYFTTEGAFVIPNASMEEWSNYSQNSKVLLPGAGGERTFWDSGNHGSATLSKTLTQGTSSMKHSGALGAELKSQFVALGVIGKFAAGNLFAGEYVKTNGTNGEIDFGREYNGSHPTKLRVYVNYRPGVVDKNGCKGKKLSIGDTDKGQIYVALTTEKVHIDTRYTDPEKPEFALWKTDSPVVLAYGEKIFSENYGPDGELQLLEIPLDYKASAKTLEPKYLVIVCTASYYGDYFDGGEGSTMCVDDFELVYE